MKAIVTPYCSRCLAQLFNGVISQQSQAKAAISALVHRRAVAGRADHRYNYSSRPIGKPGLIRTENYSIGCAGMP